MVVTTGTGIEYDKVFQMYATVAMATAAISSRKPIMLQMLTYTDTYKHNS